MKPIANLILQNGRITTLDSSHPSATEIVMVGDKFAGVDNAAAFERIADESHWMSREEGKRGAISPGQLADLAVLTNDYFTIPEEEIKSLESVLTILGGKPVYAAEEFKALDPAIFRLCQIGHRCVTIPDIGNRTAICMLRDAVGMSIINNSSFEAIP